MEQYPGIPADLTLLPITAVGNEQSMKVCAGLSSSVQLCTSVLLQDCDRLCKNKATQKPEGASACCKLVSKLLQWIPSTVFLLSST
jgi:hypothetical protein